MRSWFAIPAVGVACGGAAVALGTSPVVALAGAALAAVIRVLAGDSPAALSGAVLAPVLAVASLADAGGETARAAIALAAAGWTIVELARGSSAAVGSPGGQTDRQTDGRPDQRPDRQPDRQPDVQPDGVPGSPLGWPLGSPLVAVVPAVVAAVLDPSFVALIAIAGARLLTVAWAPRPRPRWVLAVPAAGVLAIGLAVLAGTSWPALGASWFGAAAHPIAPGDGAGLAGFAGLGGLTGLMGLMGQLGTTLGPLTAVAALAGLASLVRARYAELAVAAAIAGAALVDVRAGAVGPASIGLAALLAGLAIGRLAALIRIPSGQAIAGATIGALVIVPPAWSAFEHRPPAAHSGQASR